MSSTCAVCGDRPATLVCGNCMVTHYCTSLCMQRDAANHQLQCALIGGKRGRPEEEEEEDEDECTNRDDIITMEPVPEEHFDLIVGGKRYCFDIEALARWITASGLYAPWEIQRYAELDLDSVRRPRNPVTNMPLTDEELLRFAQVYSRFQNNKKLLIAKWFMAASTGSGKTLFDILEKHPDFDVNMRDTEAKGETALHYIVQYRGTSRDIRMLINHGANVDARDDKGRTPFMLAVKKGVMENAKLLLRLGADINAVNKEGDSAVRYAFKHDLNSNDGSMFEFLLENGANAWDFLMENLEAAGDGFDEFSEKTLHQILDAGINVNRQDGFGDTALSLVAQNIDSNPVENFAYARILIQAGANPDIRNAQGHVAADYIRNEMHRATFYYIAYQHRLSWLSRQLQRNSPLPRDIWIRIIQRAWQEEWCATISIDAWSKLIALARIMNIPGELQTMTHEELCLRISEVLSLGEILGDPEVLDRLQKRSDKMRALVQRVIAEIQRDTNIDTAGRTPDEIFAELVKRATLKWK